jgi:hypothetical protein
MAKAVLHWVRFRFVFSILAFPAILAIHRSALIRGKFLLYLPGFRSPVFQKLLLLSAPP